MPITTKNAPISNEKSHIGFNNATKSASGKPLLINQSSIREPAKPIAPKTIPVINKPKGLSPKSPNQPNIEEMISLIYHHQIFFCFLLDTFLKAHC